MTKKSNKPMPPELLELVATRFRVLGEPVRLRILQTLEEGEHSIGELAEALDLGQPSVSKHVKILQDAGLVARRQDGNTVWCSIADETVFEMCDLVCSSLRDRFERQARILRRA